MAPDFQIPWPRPPFGGIVRIMLASILGAVLAVTVGQTARPEPITLKFDPVSKRLTTDPLHPAFTLSSEAFDAIWKKGYKDGQDKRDYGKAMDRAKRQIDSYYKSLIAKEACSWAYFVHPRCAIYSTAFQAGKLYYSDRELSSARNSVTRLAGREQSRFAMTAYVNEMPSFQAPMADWLSMLMKIT